MDKERLLERTWNESLVCFTTHFYSCSLEKANPSIFGHKSIVSFIQKGRGRIEYFLSEEKLENPEKSFILKPTCCQAVDDFCRKKKDDYKETKHKQENSI